MNCIRYNARLIVCAVIVELVIARGVSSAEPTLLVELKGFGNCFDCLPTTMGFDFSVGAQNGTVGAEWSVLLQESDVGRTFDLPPTLLPNFNAALTYSGDLTIVTLFHGGDPRTIYSAALTYGSQIDVPSVARIAPVLGKNLSGYELSNITQTIDSIDVTAIAANRFSIRADHTIRIFGQTIPEPGAVDLFVLGLAVLHVRLRIRLLVV